MKITAVGLDVAKSVFTVHGVDPHGKAVLRRTVRRAKRLELFAQPCCLGASTCTDDDVSTITGNIVCVGAGHASSRR